MADPRLGAAMASASGPRAALGWAAALSQLGLRVAAGARDPVESALGAGLPPTNRVAATRLGALLGLGPDEWLLLGEPGWAARDEQVLREALGPAGGAVVDLSSARAGVVLAGADAREVLASCVALDFHPSRFAPGQCAQTLLGKVPVVIEQLDAEPRYRILVRPSHLDYAVDWLIDGIRGLASEP